MGGKRERRRGGGGEDFVKIFNSDTNWKLKQKNISLLRSPDGFE